MREESEEEEDKKAHVDVRTLSSGSNDKWVDLKPLSPLNSSNPLERKTPASGVCFLHSNVFCECRGDAASCRSIH